MIPRLTTYSLGMNTEDWELHWETPQGSKLASVIYESDSCLPQGVKEGETVGDFKIDSNVCCCCCFGGGIPIQINGKPFFKTNEVWIWPVFG